VQRERGGVRERGIEREREREGGQAGGGEWKREIEGDHGISEDGGAEASVALAGLVEGIAVAGRVLHFISLSPIIVPE
jgi:hypothetical protein